MHALIMQFDDDDGPELLEVALRAQGVAIETIFMPEPHPPLSIDGYTMLVGLGGSMCANETERYPFLEEAMSLMRQAVASDLPVLGICLGSQLLAKALGGSVTRSEVQEVGFVPVKLVPAASDDPLLRGLPAQIETVHFHEDTFSAPPKAAVLGSSEDCATQVVRCGRRAYGLQFHPEVSGETFESWVQADYVAFMGDDRGRRASDVIAEMRAHEPLIRAHGDLIFQNFVALAQ